MDEAQEDVATGTPVFENIYSDQSDVCATKTSTTRFDEEIEKVLSINS